MFNPLICRIMNARELKKMFPYLTIASIKSARSSYKTERGWLNHLKKHNEESKQECEAPFVVHLEIDITWKNSKTWGLCPHAEARWEYENGAWNYDPKAGSASGCGYDKLSSCVAEVLNKVLTRNLYEKRRLVATKSKIPGGVPYGLSTSEYSIAPWVMGGTGISCYPKIIAFLGGKMKCVVNARRFEKWVIDFKRPKKKQA